MKHGLTLLCSTLVVVATFGCSKASSASAEGTASQGAATAPAVPGQQTQGVTLGAPLVAITVNGDGFVPNQVDVKQGQKVTLRFTRTTDGTCAKAVVFPELKLEKPLPLNQAVDIEVPTDKAQTLTFQCGMGMYQSKVVVR